MSDRVGKLEEKVDKLTELLTEMVKEVKEIRSARAEAAEAPEDAGPAPGTPEYYGSLYAQLFDQWLRGERRPVLRQLRAMPAEELLHFITASKLEVKEQTDKAVMLDQLKAALDKERLKTLQQQYSGLYCMLSQEWNACNYPFVEGRLGEYSLEQLKAFAECNCINVGKTARRDAIIKAVTKLLEERRPKDQPPQTGPRKAVNPREEAYTYMHSVLFDEWNQGNRDYVNRQLESLDPQRMAAFIKVNKLPVHEKTDKQKMIEELQGIYEHLKQRAADDQLQGLYCLLSQEWNCGNRTFVERRLKEMDQTKLTSLAVANDIKVGAKAGKPALIKAVKDHLKVAPAAASGPKAS